MSIRRYNREDLPQLALRNREHRAGLAINLVAFFAAIGVLGWFGLSGLDMSPDEGPTTQQEMDALFARMQAEAEEESRTGSSAPRDAPHVAAAYEWPAEDEQEFDGPGSFGDPMTELFDDHDGGERGGSDWGENDRSEGQWGATG